LPLASGGPDGDDDVADLLTALDVAVGLDDVLEWVRAVDDRPERAALQTGPEVLENLRGLDR
jgi:hypothetical protein